MKQKKYESPVMSDAALLVSVEDLINMAMGPPDKNIVNFKMIQTVLHILARQMRMLETRVEIRITETAKQKGDVPSSSRSSSSSRSPRAQAKVRRKERKTPSKDRAKADKVKEKAERAESKERDKAERAASKEREKAERAASKERDKAERAASKERDREERAASKERDKAERAASKEREKAERAQSKEREKAEKAATKEREKAEKGDLKDRKKAEKGQEKAESAESKEREKAEREKKEKERAEKVVLDDRAKRIAKMEEEKLKTMDPKERINYEKARAKEKEQLEKMSPKEREKYEKEKEKELEQELRAEKERVKPGQKKDAKTTSGTSIAIKEVERQKEKVLIVEKGPTTRHDSSTRVGSIEVVTLSQFELLEAAVKDLTQKAGPLPLPSLPDNKKLMSELSKGSASLTDTMQAMQVSARVQAAEKAIGRMAGLLTQLAIAGALPDDVMEKLEEVTAEIQAAADEPSGPIKSQRSMAGRKSVAIDPMSTRPSRVDAAGLGPAKSTARQSVVGRPSLSAVSATSRASAAAISPPVTHMDMDEAIRTLQEELKRNITLMTGKATAAADTAAVTAKAVADKLEIALKMNTRISTLHSLVLDYAEQLSGFDAGLTTQMQSFQEQMVQMRGDLKGGLAQLELANNNAETAAVMELNERYEGLVLQLENTLTAHQHLNTFQRQLGDDLHSLLECVETLREQKADRDEVLDGLRDKADSSRLAGLLTEVEFATSREDLERKLDLCYDKFRRQEQVWMGAIKDLTNIAEGKAEIMQLLAAKDEAQRALRDVQERLRLLAVQLGEPKAAVLTRLLSRDANCGACMLKALMEPTDVSYGKPPPLPAFRPAPEGEPCVRDWVPEESGQIKDHLCHRWVGGSHTLLSDTVTREVAPPLQLQTAGTKKFAGYGSDGRLYMMEEELQPCAQCNVLSSDHVPPAEVPQDGAGDTAQATTVIVGL